MTDLIISIIMNNYSNNNDSEYELSITMATMMLLKTTITIRIVVGVIAKH